MFAKWEAVTQETELADMVKTMASRVSPDWSKIHNPEKSWRQEVVGDISNLFTIPRYVGFFHQYFGSKKNLSFLEFGSGTGDISRAILNSNTGQISEYVLSEHFDEGVEWLRNKGFKVLKFDAVNTNLESRSYDVSVSLDVMHHVEQPQRMASEMMRIARGKCFLVESNGLSVFRKLMEFTPGHRAAGERSYTPKKWRSFFEDCSNYTITKFEVTPFLFAFKTPKIFLGALVKFNRLIETLPFFRWQCASLAIYVEYVEKK